MTTADTHLKLRSARISGVVMLLIAVLAGLAFMAPRAEAAAPKRVVAISPFAAATMARLGVKPIAIGQTIGGERRKPKFLNGVRVLPLSHPNGPNLEVMAKLRPDLVFSSTRWNKGTKALRQLGIKVVYADPDKLGGVAPTVTLIGRWLGKRRQATRVNAAIRRQTAAARRGIPVASRPKVLVALGIGSTAMAFLPNSWGGQIVSQSGGRLVYGGASASGGFARISDEKVIEEDPDIIIVVPHGTGDDLDQVTDYIRNNQAWQATTAGVDDRIEVSVDNELLQSGPDVGWIINKVRREFLKNR